MREIEIVVEAGVGGRPDVQLGLREEAEDRGAQHVGGGVTELLEGSHLRAGGHVGKASLPLGSPGAESKDGGEARPTPSGLYSFTISKRIVTTTRMVLSME